MSSAHSIEKCGSTSLSSAGRFNQIWNSSSGFGLVAVDQGERLGVHDARTRGQPLHVAPPEPRRGAERVGVVDQPPSHERDGLEAPVRVLREARDVLAVVHPPAVDPLEVLAHLPAVERRVGAQHLVAGGVRVVVVHAEQERIDRGPLEPDRNGLEDGARHGRQTTSVATGSVRDVEGTRVDSWLWSVRIFRTRSAAATACRSGHVRVDGRPAKPATPVDVGDEVRCRVGDNERIVEVVRLISSRVGAPIAVECYVDRSPAPTVRTGLPACHGASGAPGGRPSGTVGRSTGCVDATAGR